MTCSTITFRGRRRPGSLRKGATVTTPPFVHLHCHSHYSLLDGASPIDEMVSRAKELGMNALAITDHGNLYGALQFYSACRDAGINPVVGYEAYVAPGSRRDRSLGETPSRSRRDRVPRAHGGADGRQPSLILGGTASSRRGPER